MYSFQQVFKKSSPTVRRGVRLLGFLLASQAANLPIMGLDQFGSMEQHFAQVVLNQGSTTTFTIYNLSASTIEVDVQLYFPNGTPLANQQTELAPGETETVSFGEEHGTLTRGWAKLSSDGEFIATEFFQLSVLGQLKPRIGVLPSTLADDLRVFGFVNDKFKSGMALHNPGNAPTEVTFRLTGQNGQQPLQVLGDKIPTEETTFMLDPLESVSHFLDHEMFFGMDLRNYEGAVEVSASPLPVAMLSLVQESSGDIATVSAVTPTGNENIITEATNTALGVDALSSNTTGEDNTAIGARALSANTTGSHNTAIGEIALLNNTEGERNIAVGDNALADNTSGSLNVAVGVVALTNNTEGDRNTAVGDAALFTNITGSNNTAMGRSALANNTEGDRNTAVGDRALWQNTTGDRNAALGTYALRQNTTGVENTALGEGALIQNTTGFRNVATGGNALFSNTTGSFNTAMGINTLFFTTTGYGNTAFGFEAGTGHETGDNNIYIGYRAGTDNETGDNNILIGNRGQATESNTIRIGDGNHTNAFIAGVPFALPSSKRFKEDIQDMGEASSSLMWLRPVTFRYKKEHNAGDGRLQYGLVAEEVAEVYPELVVHDATGKARTVLYQELSVMLLNELQKQHRQIENLMEQLKRLE